MSVIVPEREYVDLTSRGIRYLEHGWPSKLCRWHAHAEYELHLVLETSGRVFVGDYIGAFRPGDLFLTGPHVPHNWVTDSAAHARPVAVRDMLIQFSGESLDLLRQGFMEFSETAAMWELAHSGIQFEGFDPTFARGHMQRIRDARGAERVAAFLRFVARLNEHAEKRPLSVLRIVQPEGTAKHARVAKVVDHITGNFAERFSLRDAAAMAGMTPAVFSHNFQRFTGNKFIEFISRVRIGQACSMLYATDDHVVKICYAVGFQNLANFNRRFKKMKQMTPSDYRRKARAGLLNRVL